VHTLTRAAVPGCNQPAPGLAGARRAPCASPGTPSARMASLDAARHRLQGLPSTCTAQPALARLAFLHARCAGARLQVPLRRPLGPYPYPALRTCSFRCTSHLNSGGTAAPGARPTSPLRGGDGCARPAAHATRHSNRPWCSRRSLSSPTCPRRSCQQLPSERRAAATCGTPIFLQKSDAPPAARALGTRSCRRPPPPLHKPGLHSTAQRSSAGRSVSRKAASQEWCSEARQQGPTKG